MSIIIECYWPYAWLCETCNKFSCSKSPRITKEKNHPKKCNPKNYYYKVQSIKHVLSNKSDFRPNILLCYLSTCHGRPLSTINWFSPLWRQLNIDFRYPQAMHFPQRYCHNRPQDRPHEKEFELFSNKNKCLKSWNWKGRWSLVSILL